MSDESTNNSKPGRRSDGRDLREGRAAGKDITPVLRGWDYEPGTINVRKVNGADGHPKLQMRLDLGLLQMELTGRPDGVKPHGFDSLLEYFEAQLKDHRKSNGSELGFEIDGVQCQSLREEAVMYYHRYLSLFVLEDFPGVVRDTARNLRLLDLCGKYAADEQDRLVLEQYRPYITMMNARARASLLFKEGKHRLALAAVDKGLADIKEFFEQFGHEEAYGRSNEVKVLKRFGRDIRRKVPVSPAQRLQKKLDRAIKDERYEEAASLRDKLVAMHGQSQGSASGKADKGDVEAPPARSSPDEARNPNT